MHNTAVQSVNATNYNLFTCQSELKLVGIDQAYLERIITIAALNIGSVFVVS